MKNNTIKQERTVKIAHTAKKYKYHSNTSENRCPYCHVLTATFIDLEIHQHFCTDREAKQEKRNGKAQEE